MDSRLFRTVLVKTVNTICVPRIVFGIETAENRGLVGSAACQLPLNNSNKGIWKCSFARHWGFARHCHALLLCVIGAKPARSLAAKGLEIGLRFIATFYR